MLQIQVALLFVVLTWFPGYLLLRCFRMRVESTLPLLVFLPPVFGIPLISLAYFVFRIFHLEAFFYFVPMGAFLGSVFLLRRSGTSLRAMTDFSGHWRSLLLLAVSFAVFMLFFSSYTARIHHDAGGGFVIGDNAYNDHIWGVSVSAELMHRVPPMLPIFSGYKLKYHYLADLFVELLYRESGTHLRMLEFYYKGMPPILIFWLLGTLLLVFQTYFKRFSLTFLAILLLFFLPVPSAIFFKHHYTLTVLFFYTAVFLLLPRYFERGEPAFGRAAFLILAILPLYDLIIGGVMLGAIAVYGLMDSIAKKTLSPILKYCLFAMALTGVCVIALLGLSHGGPASFVAGEGILLRTARNQSRHWDSFLNFVLAFFFSNGFFLQDMIRTCVLAFSRFMVFLYTLFFPLAASPIQYHFLAFPVLWAALRHPEHKKGTNAIVAWSLLLSFGVSAFVIYKPDGPSVPALDRAFYFLSVSLMPFTVQAIAGLWASRRIWLRVALILMAVLYLLPHLRSSISSLTPRYYSYIDKDSMQMFDYIRDQTGPGSIILHPFHDNPIFADGKPSEKPAWIFKDHYFFMSALGERQAVFEGAVSSTTYFMGDIAYADAVKRLNEVDRFYQTNDPVWARDFLRKLNVGYVWIPQDKPLLFKAGEFLSPVFQNGKHMLCKVVII